MSNAIKPLQGLRVLEMGQLIAGPFAGQMLAYFGAEVVKIEPPRKGDPLRNWRVLDEQGTSYWWASIARNKKSLTLDLNHEQGQLLARQLLDKADVLIENFRPGKMEAWGLGPDDVKTSNPSLVYTRVSGYGQNGPYAQRPGFASVCEAEAGMRYVNGFPGEAPVRANLSLGDTFAGMHAVIGTLLALMAKAHTNGMGQSVDVSIVESVFNMMEGVQPEYDGANAVREPSGTTVTGIVPTNTYRCRNDVFIVIGGNGDSIFKRLMVAIGQPDMATDSRLADNAGRVACEAEIDRALAEWASQHEADAALAILQTADVPAGPINSIREISQDPHFIHRGMFESVDVGGQNRSIPALHPKLQNTPGNTVWAGPELGQHTTDVLQDWLGLSPDDIASCKRLGVI